MPMDPHPPVFALRALAGDLPFSRDGSGDAGGISRYSRRARGDPLELGMAARSPSAPTVPACRGVKMRYSATTLMARWTGATTATTLRDARSEFSRVNHPRDRRSPCRNRLLSSRLGQASPSASRGRGEAAEGSRA